MVFAANAVQRQGFKPERVLLIGGAARNPAVQEVAAEMFATTIQLPPPGEYVADGAARQAAWALSGKLPNWQLGEIKTISLRQCSSVAENYLELISKI
jgi:xylulokinase